MKNATTVTTEAKKIQMFVGIEKNLINLINLSDILNIFLFLQTLASQCTPFYRFELTDKFKNADENKDAVLFASIFFFLYHLLIFGRFKFFGGFLLLRVCW